MKRLILDFLARWWWVLAILAVNTVIAASVAEGLAQIFSLYVLGCVFFDAVRGVLGVVGLLPLARRKQAHAWWLLIVVVLPLLWLVPLTLGAIFHQAEYGVHPSPGSPGDALFGVEDDSVDGIGAAPWHAALLSAAVQDWVIVGNSAVLFLGAALLPVRPAAAFKDRVVQAVKIIPFPLLVVGGLSLPRFLPWHPEHLGIWNWTAFAAVSVFVVLSFIASPGLLVRRQMVRPPEFSRARAENFESSPAEGLSGLRLFLVTVAGPFLLVLFQSVLGEVCLLWWKTGLEKYTPEAVVCLVMGVWIAMGGLASSVLIRGWFNPRTLRTLPLTRSKLAALIVAVPAALGVCGAAFILGIRSLGVGGLGVVGVSDFAVQVLMLGGFGTLCLAFLLYFRSVLRFVVLILAWEIPAVGYDRLIGTAPLLAAFSGVAAFALGFFLIRRGLRRSKAFYRSRNTFGMNFGHALAPR